MDVIKKKKLFMYSEKRRRILSILSPPAGALMGIVVGGLLLAIYGANPVVAYISLFRGSLLGWRVFSETLIMAVPLSLAGLAVCFSYRAGLFNIGAEGQLYLGALGGTLVGLYVPGLPSFFHIALAVLAGSFFGGLLALIPGLLRAYRGVSEIITTMLLNYVAALFLSMLVEGPLKAEGAFYAQSERVAESALIPTIWSSNLHAGIYMMLVLSVFLYWFFVKTAFGLDMEAAGGNREALHYAGVNIKKLTVQVMFFSGMIAGSAGVLQVLGVHRRLMENFAVGLGYEAIAVALLANLNPIGAIFSGIFFATLKTGATSMQVATGVPSSFVAMIQALTILFVIMFAALPRIVDRFFRWRSRRCKT